MISEYQRLLSFEYGTSQFSDIVLMAETGLYLVDDNVAKCFSCGLLIYSLEKDECVVERHLKYSPKCIFMNGGKTENVPIN